MKTIIFTILFLISTTVLADTEAKIKRIAVIEEPGFVYVYPEGRVNDPLSCHSSNGNYISFSLDRSCLHSRIPARCGMFCEKG